MFKQEALTVQRRKPANGSFNLIKAIVMLGLPFVHIMESYNLFGVLSAVPESFENAVCSFTVVGPSIFMICMGLGLTNISSPKRIRKVGIQMIIIFEMLNVVRFCIPYFITWKAGLTNWMYILAFFESDIYMFVGLFYILFSYLKEAKLSTFKIFLISLAMLIINIVVSSFVYMDQFVATVFLGNIVSVSDNSYFPLLGWFIFPCIGMLLEEKILSLDFRKRSKAFGIILGSAVIMLLVSAAVINLAGGSPFETLADFATNTRFCADQACLLISITLITISLVYFIYQFIKENPVEKFILSLSPLVFPFYIIQWIGTSLVSYYAVGIAKLVFNNTFTVSLSGYFLVSLSVAIVCIVIIYKRGFTFSKWIFRISDYSRWHVTGKRTR